MNTLKEKAVKKYDNAIANLTQLRDAINLLPDALLELPGAWIINSEFSLRVDIALTATALKQARRALGRDWKQDPTAKNYQADNGSCYFFFIHGASKVKLTLCLDATDPGATCQRQQVGVKEVPIYETICR